MSSIKDIWQEAYDNAREQGMGEIMASDHADDILVDLHGTRLDLTDITEEVGDGC